MQGLVPFSTSSFNANSPVELANATPTMQAPSTTLIRQTDHHMQFYGVSNPGYIAYIVFTLVPNPN